MTFMPKDAKMNDTVQPSRRKLLLCILSTVPMFAGLPIYRALAMDGEPKTAESDRNNRINNTTDGQMLTVDPTTVSLTRTLRFASHIRFLPGVYRLGEITHHRSVLWQAEPGVRLEIYGRDAAIRLLGPGSRLLGNGAEITGKYEHAIRVEGAKSVVSGWTLSGARRSHITVSGDFSIIDECRVYGEAPDRQILPHGVWVDGAMGAIVRRLDIQGTGQGVTLGDGTRNSVVSDCVLMPTGQHGIYAQAVTGCHMVRNEIYAPYQGIKIQTSAHARNDAMDNIIANNNITSNSHCVLLTRLNASQHMVRNTIVHGNCGVSLRDYGLYLADVDPEQVSQSDNKWIAAARKQCVRIVKSKRKD